VGIERDSIMSVTVPAPLYERRRPAIAYADIPLNAATMLRNIVVGDEGGWVLDEEPDGSDHGWTFGGMTYGEFDEFFVAPNLEEVKVIIADVAKNTKFRQDILSVYTEDYYMRINTLKASDIQQMHLSCAINCGYTGFMSVLSDMNKSKKTFQTAWKDRYLTICRNNPAKLRDLPGWINRVWKYL
jgi:hypothetical protein